MSWVRYDDMFDSHPKVTGVIVDDPGAIGLHTLANTWTNRQKRKGFIPAHQPGVLVCDKQLGATWAAVLVKHGLWHRTEDVHACVDCKEEYADLPGELEGFVVHNAGEYRPPARDKSTPGTPSDLSEKRREAGRKGGQASARGREHSKQSAKANQANGASKSSKPSSNRVSPDPVPDPVIPPPSHPPAEPVTSDRPEWGEGDASHDRELAELVAEISRARPEWMPAWITEALGHPDVAARPLPLRLEAARLVLLDPATKQPGRLAANGPWWADAAAALNRPVVAAVPDWCGQCDENTRQMTRVEKRTYQGHDQGETEVITRCPDCHPSMTGRRPA